MTSNKPEFCLDSNMIGILYGYIKEGRSYFNKYPSLDTMALTMIEYFCKHYKEYNLYITPQVYREQEYGMSLLGDEYTEFKKSYMNFIRDTFIPIIPYGYSSIDQLSQSVNTIKEKYLEKNILLSDNTSAPQSAVAHEIKKYSLYEEMKKLNKPSYTADVFEEEFEQNGSVIFRNFGDALVVTESNMFKGIPILTLNEKHLIKIAECSPKLRRKDLRSYFILKKNKEIVDSNMVEHKKIRANLKRKNSTTISIKNLLDYVK